MDGEGLLVRVVAVEMLEETPCVGAGGQLTDGPEGAPAMGGAGAWYLGSRHAERFAALVAVCGYVTGTARHPGPFVDSEEPFSELAEAVAGLPIWIFHGGADQVIPVAESQGIAAALEAIGADVTYTEFEGVNHNSWDSAYSTDGLAPWLFSQKRERSRQD